MLFDNTKLSLIIGIEKEKLIEIETIIVAEEDHVAMIEEDHVVMKENEIHPDVIQIRVTRILNKIN